MPNVSARWCACHVVGAGQIGEAVYVQMPYGSISLAVGNTTEGFPLGAQDAG